ncbi:MAG TPA: MerR family transcriptional regulator [Candidatus Binataceae bacterium]|nr:MerR family transcriptional regulator [Candidatus Binataceae bacterium]
MATARPKITRPKAANIRPRRPAPAAGKPVASKSEVNPRPLKIGAAARALEVEPYVLRFWETQFPFLRPRHTNSSHRMYEPDDLQMLRLVKRLLHVDGYTIAGAKKYIRETGLERLCADAGSVKSAKSERVPPDQPKAARRPSPTAQSVIAEIRADLKALRKLLDD